MFRPTCHVYLNGAELAPVPSTTSPFVLSPVVASWGRSNPLDNADPATGRVQVFDPTFTWASAVDYRNAADRLGDDLDVGWTHPDLALDAVVYFRGRVQAVDLEPATFRVGGVDVDGVIVTLALVSRLADLANHRPQTLPWAAQDAAARASAISGGELSFYGSTVNNVWTLSGAPSRALHSVPADDKRTLYEHLLAIYDNTGTRLTYSPDMGRVRPVARRSFSHRGLVGLRRATTSTDRRYGQGAYLAPIDIVTPGDTNPSTNVDVLFARQGQYLDGAAVDAPSGSLLSRAAEQRTTSLQVDWTDNVGAKQTTTLEVARLYGAARQVRRVKFDSELYVTAEVAALAAELASMLAREGSAWRVAPITWDTREAGGFDSASLLLELLAGWETPTIYLLSNTVLPRLGVRPVFGIMGATITHTAGDWAVTLQLAPVFTSVPQHAITPTEVDNGGTNTLRVYLDGADHADGLHRSVTCEDLRYCAAGLGVTQSGIGPDQGWDTYQ